VQSAALHPRDYTWLETRIAMCESASPSIAEMELDLEGISCVGCVWLIEKIFRDRPGAVRIEINTQYGQVRMKWRSGIFDVTAFAREIQQFGYIFGPPGERPQQESRRLLGKLGLCGAFALNAMIFTLPRYLGMDPSFSLAPLFELLALLFATLALLTGGSYFIKRGFKGVLQGVLHIDFPIAIGILVAWTGSVLGWIIVDARFLYFDFVAVFIFLMLVGRWIQERALENNRHRLLSHNKTPKDVHVVAEDLQTEETRPLDALRSGERIRVMPGEVVPVLGELESKQAAISLEWINGESAMRSMDQGQWIPSGAQNIGIEPVLLIAHQTWKESLLNRLLAARPAEQRNRHLEQILRIYLVIVLFTATGGGLFWSLGKGDSLTAVQVILSVLVVSCPCALGVAYPLAQEWAVLHLRPHGIFVRSNDLFNRLANIRGIVFDKTGTLTLEAPELADPDVLLSLEGPDLAVLREMVKSSLHPVSRALRDALLSIGTGNTLTPEDLHIREEVGMGLVASSALMSSSWTLGRPGWKSSDGGIPDAHSECDFQKNGRLLAGFNFREALREDALSSIDVLRNRYSIHILSGDRQVKVQKMARKLKLPEESAIGDQTPEEKASFVEALGTQSLYIGDGANDSLAFSKARVRGTPATPHGLLQDKADFYFTGRSLSGLLHMFRIQKLRQDAVRSAFAFAVVYNFGVVALALHGNMHPLLAAILMPLSSLSTLSIVAAIYRRGNKAVLA